jgi:hypothetical protein
MERIITFLIQDLGLSFVIGLTSQPALGADGTESCGLINFFLGIAAA